MKEIAQWVCGVLQCISAQGDGEWNSMLVSSVSYTHVTFS
jgi:hypothetical protein